MKNYLSVQATTENLIALSVHHDRKMAQQIVSDITQRLIERTGKGWDLSGSNLSKIDLRGFDLRRAVFNRTQLYETNLSYANLSAAEIVCPGMEKTNLSHANLSHTNMHALAAQVCNFENANMSEIIDLTGGLFHGCHMRGINAKNSKFSGSTFFQCNLEQAIFEHATLEGCTFNESNLLEINLHGAKCARLLATNLCMTNSNLSRIDGQEAVFRDCNLSESDLSEAYLYRSSFTGRTNSCMLMRKVNLASANLIQADIFANLDHSNLEGAFLSYARMNQCLLRKANLKGAKTHFTSMIKTDVTGTDLSTLQDTILIFSGTGWAEAAKHNAFIQHLKSGLQNLLDNPSENKSSVPQNLNNKMLESYGLESSTGSEGCVQELAAAH